MRRMKWITTTLGYVIVFSCLLSIEAQAQAICEAECLIINADGSVRQQVTMGAQSPDKDSGQVLYEIYQECRLLGQVEEQSGLNEVVLASKQGLKVSAGTVKKLESYVRATPSRDCH